MDLECDGNQWTFFINPKKRDTIKVTRAPSEPVKDKEEIGEVKSETSQENKLEYLDLKAR